MCDICIDAFLDVWDTKDYPGTSQGNLVMGYLDLTVIKKKEKYAMLLCNTFYHIICGLLTP